MPWLKGKITLPDPNVKESNQVTHLFEQNAIFTEKKKRKIARTLLQIVEAKRNVCTKYELHMPSNSRVRHDPRPRSIDH